MTEEKTLEISKDLNFSFSKNDLNVQSLGFKSISYLNKLKNLLLDYSKIEDSNIGTVISYTFSYQCKDLAILFRDAMLNLLKMEQYRVDGLKSEDELQDYKNKVGETIESAISSLSANFKSIIEETIPINKEWQHELNPVPYLNEQIESICSQIKNIQRSQHKLDQLTLKFSDYRYTYNDILNQRTDRIKELHDLVIDLRDSFSIINDDFLKKKAIEVVGKLQSTIDTLDQIKSFPFLHFAVLEDTNKLKIAVDTDGGRLIYKTVDILSEISGWSSFYLISPLKAIDVRINSYKDKIQIATLQLLNRLKAQIESNEEDEKFSKSDLKIFTSKLLKEYKEELEPNCVEKSESVRSDLNSYVIPSQLFNKEYNFLPSSAVGQLAGFNERNGLQRRYSPARIKSIIGQYSERLFKNYSHHEGLTAAGFINKVLSFDVENEAYSLFTKGGFLGSSFSVDRPELMDKIEKHFNLWNEGYGGALMVSGRHLTGRSSLLEMIPLVYPDIISHHIVPGQKLEIAGNVLVMPNNLIETLEFIIKYMGPGKCMVTIDDLDYYTSNPAKTFELIEELFKIIAKYGSKIYFVLAIHEFLEEKLRMYFDFESLFSERLSTNYMPTESIEEAVRTRAHAVANNEDILSQSDALTTLARKVARKSNENIGKAMQLWCMYHFGSDIGDGSNKHFRDLVLRHSRILKTLVMHGSLFQPDLDTFLNRADAYDQNIEINALIQMRLLQRIQGKYIRINPRLLIFIESILSR